MATAPAAPMLALAALAAAAAAAASAPLERGCSDPYGSCNFDRAAAMAGAPYADDSLCTYPPAPGRDCAGTPCEESSAADNGACGDFTVKHGYSLGSRPRRAALLLIDSQEEYRSIIPGAAMANLADLSRAFGENGMHVVRSAWARREGDGVSNAYDRIAPVGAQGGSGFSVVYSYRLNGTEVLPELVPQPNEPFPRLTIASESIDLFWNFERGYDGRGGPWRSVLDTHLTRLGVDTVVIAGLWSDACILATAIGALNRGYDAFVVEDAVATATKTAAAAAALVQVAAVPVTAAEAVGWAEARPRQWHEGMERYTQVRGAWHPDGRL